MRVVLAFVLISSQVLAATRVARAQETPHSGQPELLAGLLVEAERNNPQIQAVRHELEAAKRVPTQLSTLPDPQVVLQHVSVGSPRPFAGYTNSDFAYIGLGFSQDIPYPGKLRLRGEIAKKDADVSQERSESVRRTILVGVKAAYFQLGFLAKRRAILESDEQLLQQVEQAAEAHYRSGMGNQQEVIQAQLQKTKLLRETTETELEAAKVQTGLKQLLNRQQTAPDVIPTDPSETPLAYSYDQLLAAALANNPEITIARKTVEKQGLQVDLARKDFYPDFNVQYMWQRTDPTQFRAYYMLTLGVRIPVYKRQKQQPELVQAQADQNRARSEYEMQSQQVAAELRQEFLIAEKSTDLLKIYREGLVPQAHAELQAGLAAYQSNREDFQALLASFLDVLKLDQEYWQALADRETAVAQIERATGLSLRR
jgi:outer membrane protein TolC